MTADKISLNDRQWNEEFRQKVLQEIERKQDEREERLAEAEAQRIQRLRLQGILRDENAGKQEAATRKTLSEKRFDKRSEKKHQSIFKPNDIESQMEILNRSGESETRSGNRSHSGNSNSIGSFYENAEDTTNGIDFDTLPTYKSHLGRTKEEIKEEHPRIKEFYEEEDLKQLYREAENLVRRTRYK